MLTLARPYLGRVLLIDKAANHIVAEVSCQDTRGTHRDMRIGFEAGPNVEIQRPELLRDMIELGRTAPTYMGQDLGWPPPWLPTLDETKMAAAAKEAARANARLRRIVEGGRR